MLEGLPPSGHIILLAPHKLRQDLGLASLRSQKGKLRLKGKAQSEEWEGWCWQITRQGGGIPEGPQSLRSCGAWD